MPTLCDRVNAYRSNHVVQKLEIRIIKVSLLQCRNGHSFSREFVRIRTFFREFSRIRTNSHSHFARIRAFSCEFVRILANSHFFAWSTFLVFFTYFRIFFNISRNLIFYKFFAFFRIFSHFFAIFRVWKLIFLWEKQWKFVKKGEIKRKFEKICENERN